MERQLINPRTTQRHVCYRDEILAQVQILLLENSILECLHNFSPSIQSSQASPQPVNTYSLADPTTTTTTTTTKTTIELVTCRKKKKKKKFGFIETIGNEITHPCSDGRSRFLQQIPQPLLILRALSLAKFLLLPLPQRLRLLPHLLVHVLLPLMILVLATTLQIQLVDSPVLEVVAERQHAHLVDEVELAGTIEI